MLGKLLKYELKATSRIFLPLFVVLVLFAIITKIFFTINNNSTVMNLVTGLGTAAYVLSIIIIFVLTLIVMIQRFYKNLLGDEGYLMFTLPVSSSMQIAAKLIIAIFWQIVSLALTAGTVLIVAYRPDIWSILSDGFNQIYNGMNKFGLNVPAITTEIIITTLISLTTSILMIYASISIGHLFTRHKILASFGSFLALSMANQAISSIIVLIASVIEPKFLTDQTVAPSYVNILIIGAMVIDLLFGAAYYFITKYILQKHLNLE